MAEVCAFCLDQPARAVILVECGHTFCAACFRDYIENNNGTTCISCRDPFIRSVPNRALRGQLNHPDENAADAIAADAWLKEHFATARPPVAIPAPPPAAIAADAPVNNNEPILTPSAAHLDALDAALADLEDDAAERARLQEEEDALVVARAEARRAEARRALIEEEERERDRRATARRVEDETAARRDAYYEDASAHLATMKQQLLDMQRGQSINDNEEDEERRLLFERRPIMPNRPVPLRPRATTTAAAKKKKRPIGCVTLSRAQASRGLAVVVGLMLVAALAFVVLALAMPRGDWVKEFPPPCVVSYGCGSYVYNRTVSPNCASDCPLDTSLTVYLVGCHASSTCGWDACAQPPQIELRDLISPTLNCSAGTITATFDNATAVATATGVSVSVGADPLTLHADPWCAYAGIVQFNVAAPDGKGVNSVALNLSASFEAELSAGGSVLDASIAYNVNATADVNIPRLDGWRAPTIFAIVAGVTGSICCWGSLVLSVLSCWSRRKAVLITCLMAACAVGGLIGALVAAPRAPAVESPSYADDTTRHAQYAMVEAALAVAVVVFLVVLNGVCILVRVDAKPDDDV